MKGVINNLLVLLIFLSPVVSGLDLSNCHSKENVSIEKVDCHEPSEKIVSSFVCNNCCDGVCADCSLHNYVDKIIPLRFPITVKHNSLSFIYNESIPFINLFPPFRPPIS